MLIFTKIICFVKPRGLLYVLSQKSYMLSHYNPVHIRFLILILWSLLYLVSKEISRTLPHPCCMSHPTYLPLLYRPNDIRLRFQWSCGIRHAWSSIVQTVDSWIGIPVEAQMFYRVLLYYNVMWQAHPTFKKSYYMPKTVAAFNSEF